MLITLLLKAYKNRIYPTDAQVVFFTDYLKSHPATKQESQLQKVERSPMDRITKELREELATKIGQRVEQEFEGKEVERIYNILIKADFILDKAKTEREIIAIYDMIAKRLKEVTYKYKPRIRTAYVLYHLAEIVHESIKEYLPHRVYETDLVKIIWPGHPNCTKLYKTVHV